MTPEQLATLLARAVPEMRWTVDGHNVDADGDVVSTHYRDAGPEGAGIALSGELDRRLVPVYAPASRRLLPVRSILDALTVAVADLLPDADRATWARGLHARAEVLRAERAVTERGAAMRDAIDAYNDAVTALRSAQAHLEAVQDG